MLILTWLFSEEYGCGIFAVVYASRQVIFYFTTEAIILVVLDWVWVFQLFMN